jgi:acetamidase/formamidase
VPFQVFVRKDFHFPSPLLETPSEWIVHGFDEDFNVAMRKASVDMLKPRGIFPPENES